MEAMEAKATLVAARVAKAAAPLLVGTETVAATVAVGGTVAATAKDAAMEEADPTLGATTTTIQPARFAARLGMLRCAAAVASIMPSPVRSTR
jgi:hypothetical protein